MAQAIISGVKDAGLDATIIVGEPIEARRESLKNDLGVEARVFNSRDYGLRHHSAANECNSHIRKPCQALPRLGPPEKAERETARCVFRLYGRLAAEFLSSRCFV